MKWIAWGSQMVEGEKVPYQVGVFECASVASTALAVAREQYRTRSVEHVQSAVSYEVERLEAEETKKNVRWRARRKKQPTTTEQDATK